MSEKISFLKLIRDEKTEWLMINYPNAFVLLSIIAHRVARTEDNPSGYPIGTAHIGDWKELGWSEQQYRTAKQKLIEFGLIEIVETNRTRKKSPFKQRLNNDRTTTGTTTATTTRGTLVKILNSDIYDLNLKTNNDFNNAIKTETSRECNDEQEAKEAKKLFRLEKEANKKKKTPAKRSPSLLRKKVNPEDIDALVSYCIENKIAISETDFTNWLREWDAKYIVDHLLLLQKRGAVDPARWMQTALKTDYVGEDKRLENNKIFAEQAKFQYGWIDLTITEKYCRDERTGKDFMLNMKENVFQNLLMNEIKLKEGAM